MAPVQKTSKVSFGPKNHDNADYTRLVADIKEFTKQHPDTTLKPQEFAKRHTRYQDFNSTSFYGAYTKAKEEAEGEYSFFAKYFVSNVFVV